jgi:hypothetical protein
MRPVGSPSGVRVLALLAALQFCEACSSGQAPPPDPACVDRAAIVRSGVSMTCDADQALEIGPAFDDGALVVCRCESSE